MDQAGASRRD